MANKMQNIPMEYTDHDGGRRTIKGCNLSVDHLGRHWLWSEALQENLTYKTKGKENALMSAIDSLLFTVKLRDERIKALQQIADAAMRFADEVKPSEIE